MDIQKAKDFWMDEAEESLRVADHLFEKQDFSCVLFFGHLAVEKLLKALYVIKKGEQAPYIPILYDWPRQLKFHLPRTGKMLS